MTSAVWHFPLTLRRIGNPVRIAVASEQGERGISPIEAILSEGPLYMPTARARVLNSKMLYEGKVFSVRQDRIVEPGGIEVTRDIVVHRGSVVLLPVFPDGSILLVRQYRHAIGAMLWELVAGRLEPGESKAAGARRELIEETGYTARNVKQILEIFPSPGFVTERMWIFTVTGLQRGVAQPEEDERITARQFSLTALEQMIRCGSLHDAKSVAAILFYARFLKSK